MAYQPFARIQVSWKAGLEAAGQQIAVGRKFRRGKIVRQCVYRQYEGDCANEAVKEALGPECADSLAVYDRNPGASRVFRGTKGEFSMTSWITSPAWGM
jgi:hypothetical protein